MSEARHTPRPWHLDAEGDVTSANGKTIAMLLDASDGDAQLFLAAPDMLEALEAVVWAYDCDLGWQDQIARNMERIRAVISKATGESK